MSDRPAEVISDDDALGEELVVQNDFRAATSHLLAEQARNVPASLEKCLQQWVDLLNHQPGVAAAAFLKLDVAGKRLQCVAPTAEDPMVSRFAESPFRRELLRCFGSPQRLAMVPPRKLLGENVQVFVQPLLPLRFQIALLAISNETAAVHVDNMIEAVAVYAVTSTTVYLEKQVAQQEQAALIAHMSSTSILAAQFQIDSAMRKLETSQKATSHLRQALAALRDAQAGLDRSRLFGVPWSRQEQHCKLGPLLAETGTLLNEEIVPTLVSAESLRRCRRATGVIVRAGQERLRCALHDTLLAAWLLADGAPLDVRVSKRGVRIATGPTRLPKETSQERLMDMLTDPGQYVFSLPEVPSARGVGLYLPRKLMEEMNGTMRARLDAQRRLTVELEWRHN